MQLKETAFAIESLASLVMHSYLSQIGDKVWVGKKP